MSRRLAALLLCLAAPLPAAGQSAGLAAPGDCAAPLPELDTGPVAGPRPEEPPPEEPPDGVVGVPGDLFGDPGGPLPAVGAAGASLSTGAAPDPLRGLDGAPVDPAAALDPLAPTLDPVSVPTLGADLLGQGG